MIDPQSPGGLKSAITNNTTIQPNTELLETLRATLPQFFEKDIADTDGNITERGAFKSDKFLEEIKTNNIAEARDGYKLGFVGKDYARLQTGRASETVIVPDCKHNALPENKDSGNVFITGDNIEALRHLVNAYENSIKLIYIDPPYNTGKEFVYSDKFEFDDEKLQSALGYTPQEVDRLKSIQGKSSHSAWLTFMYPRLKIAQKLLTPDGVIFVSIDDNEQANLKLLMDDVFGEGNFVGEFIWRKKDGGGQANEYFAIEHEYIIVYRKSDELIWKDNETARDISEFNKTDANGNFKITKLTKWGNTARKEDRPSMYFPLLSPDETEEFPIAPDGNDGRWRVGKVRMDELIKNNLIYWEKRDGKWVAYEKEYFENQSKILKQRSILYSVANTGNGTNVLTELFQRKDLFENPKPIELIREFLSITEEDSLILDFFAGSATTAHAVMQLNAEDNGNRKYIMVQWDEPTNEDSEARKAGYKTIDQISRERIKRAGEKIVGSGQWAEKRKKEMQEYGCTELSRSDRMAESDESNSRGLSFDKETSKGGDLFADQSNAESGGINSVEYSGGASEEIKKGVHSVSINSKRLESGIGDTITDLRQDRLPCRYGYKSSNGPAGGNQQNACCSHKDTVNCPLTTNHFDRGFKHYRLVTPDIKTLDKIETFDPSSPALIAEDMITPFAKPETETSGLETLLTTWLIDDGFTFDTPITKVDIAGYATHLVHSKLYLIAPDWSSPQTKELLNRIGTNTLNVQHIVVYAYSFIMESLRELEINIKNTLDGDHQVYIERRY